MDWILLLAISKLPQVWLEAPGESLRPPLVNDLAQFSPGGCSWEGLRLPRPQPTKSENCWFKRVTDLGISSVRKTREESFRDAEIDAFLLVFLTWSSNEELRPELRDPICDPHQRYSRPLGLIRIRTQSAFFNSTRKRTRRNERTSNDVTFVCVWSFSLNSHINRFGHLWCFYVWSFTLNSHIIQSLVMCLKKVLL